MTNELHQKADEKRKNLSFPFIGITGSNGKTTTKRMLATILRRQGRVYDFAYDADTADKIAQELMQVDGEYEWALVKMGATAPDEVGRSARLVHPQIGIVTNVGEAHLDTFDSIEKIAEAKSALVKALPNEGTAILNRDNDYVRNMGKDTAAKKLFFGMSEAADYAAANLDHLGPDGTAFTVRRKHGTSLRLNLPIYSLGDVYNALAAIAAADVLQVSDAIIADTLENDFVLSDGRGKLYHIGNICILDDTYDATPQSLLKSSRSLLNFRDYSARLVLVLGDMTGLGIQAEEQHKRTGYYLSGMPIDVCCFVGKYASTTAGAVFTRPITKRSVHAFKNMIDALEFLLSDLRNGDTVLVEGSESEDMSTVVKALVQKANEKNESTGR